MKMVGKSPDHWLLLRGLVREQAHWGSFPKCLQATFPDSQVHLLDLPGNGIRFHEASPLSLAETARWVHGQAEALKGSLGVVAISLGGMVATEWLAQHPERLARLILINTSMRGSSPFWRRLRPRNYPTLLRTLLTSEPVVRERLILEMTTHLIQNPDLVAANWAKVAQTHPVSRLNALRQLWAAACYRRPLRPPHCPTLILTSTQDGLVDTRCSENLSKLWGAQIARHSSAGHDLPLDDEEWVCQQIQQWLLASGLE